MTDPSEKLPPNAEPFRQTRAAADHLEEHLTSAIAEFSQPQLKATPMTTAPPGSFAASLKAMMDEARAGVVQARADGIAKVGEAVGKLGDAKAAVTHVTGTMAAAIESEAADVMAELGQISNDLGI